MPIDALSREGLIWQYGKIIVAVRPVAELLLPLRLGSGHPERQIAATGDGPLNEGTQELAHALMSRSSEVR